MDVSFVAPRIAGLLIAFGLVAWGIRGRWRFLKASTACAGALATGLGSGALIMHFLP